jgi:CRISPR-associated protein Cmr3
MEQTNCVRKGFCLDPLDLLSFRDGRPFGGGSYAKSGLPVPQTLTGAMRTALLLAFGCRFEKLAKEVGAGKGFGEALEASGAPPWIGKTLFRGPWLAAHITHEVELFLPVPANVHRSKEIEGDYHVLKPLHAGIPSPGWKPAEGEPRMRPLWFDRAGRTERATGFLSLSGLRDYLASKNIAPRNVVAGGSENPLYGFSERTGIGIDPDSFSVQEGLIYGAGFLALSKGICFYGEALLPDSAPSSALDGIELVSFGGEGRKAVLRQVPAAAWPSPPGGAGQKSFLVLTTPAFFAGGWKPRAIAGKIAGAAVAEGIPVSGWDLARGGPKPTRFAAPAGSVYFLDELMTQSIDNLSEGEEDLLTGYGCCLKGVWTDGTE